MDIRSWLQEVALLIVVCEITSAESDLLESFRPNADNPPELNGFLSNVLEHKQDFNYVRQAARKYQKMKKDTQDLYDPLSNSMDFLNFQDIDNKLNSKRHVYHSNNSAKRKFRNLGLLPPNMRNKFHRIRRRAKKLSTEKDETKNLKKRFPTIIMLQQEDDSVRKRMPAPIAIEPGETKTKKHLPSQIFLEPQGEPIQKRQPEQIVVVSEGDKGKIAIGDEVLKRTPEVDRIENDIDATGEESMENPKEKKQILDIDSEAVHRTYKSHQGRQHNDVRNKQGDLYYVDLENAAEKDRDRTTDKRRYGWDARPMFYSPSENMMYGRPLVARPRPESIHSSYPEYPEYDNGAQHSINDEIAFEKALSYEIEPRFPEASNNPAGNSLYSVDEGRPDNIQPLYQGGFSSMGEYEFPMQDLSGLIQSSSNLLEDSPGISNEKFYIDADATKKRLGSSSTEGSASSTTAKAGGAENKNLKHIGNGFIEITKSRRNSGDMQFRSVESDLLSKSGYPENKEDDSMLRVKNERNKKHGFASKLFSSRPLMVKDTSHEDFVDQNEESDEDDSVHVLKKREALVSDDADHFQSRKLKFIDYEMANEDENYEEVPVRARRDFLDALGMKNEEDYSEDNPYVNEMNINNTDVHNDTHIHEASCSKRTTTHKPTSTSRHQKEDAKNIKQMLEESKNATTVGKKKTRRSSRMDDVFDDEVREVRESDKEIETKISQNKEKIFNSHEASRNGNVNHVQVRRQPDVSKESDDAAKLNDLKNSLQLDRLLEKKNDKEENETEVETTTVVQTGVTEKDNSTDSVNTNYEQIAHQMDVENEKLAQVVNGHLASSIVTKVFSELKKKSELKAKFYSGLSRKHVNYAGTIDFDIFKANETEDVDEARLLLGQITKVLNRLVLNQVRRRLCQRLPDELQEYLDVLLNVKNTITAEASNFAPNTKQGDYLFSYQEDKRNEPSVDVSQLENSVESLESLLISYNGMNEECQNRALPVKDYIEKHVKIAKQMINCPSHNCEKFGESKRNTPIYGNPMLEKQLESVGLGRNQEFIPNFDLNQMVRNKMRPIGLKSDKKRDVAKSGYRSPQYKKLQLAVERVREKRENAKKIAEVFGKQKRSLKKFDVDYEEPVVYSLG